LVDFCNLLIADKFFEVIDEPLEYPSLPDVTYIPFGDITPSSNKALDAVC
jgi:hypothetical protein